MVGSSVVIQAELWVVSKVDWSVSTWVVRSVVKRAGRMAGSMGDLSAGTMAAQKVAR